jgi:CDP-diacylglycerol--glycerol-3-phosphate 3-phosphatidyltransferase
MSESEWSAKHGNVEIKGFVKGWIALSKFLAWPFIKLRLKPNVITTLSIVVSIPLIFSPELWWLVLISLILDGIDGRVALETNSSTKFGAIYDSIADRIVEFIWISALITLGVNLKIATTLLILGWTQEYLRARVGGLGYREIGIVTIGERPTRAIFILLALIFTGFKLQIISIALIVQIISLSLLARHFYKCLSQ